VRELKELETLDGLVIAVVEELGVGVDVPFFWPSKRGVTTGDVAGNLVGCAVLLGLFDCALGPGACCEVISSLLLTIVEQVVADG